MEAAHSELAANRSKELEEMAKIRKECNELKRSHKFELEAVYAEKKSLQESHDAEKKSLQESHDDLSHKLKSQEEETKNALKQVEVLKDGLSMDIVGAITMPW